MCHFLLVIICTRGQGRILSLDRCTILLPLLRLTLPTEGFPWDDLRKILHQGQRMAKVHSGEVESLIPPE